MKTRMTVAKCLQLGLLFIFIYLFIYLFIYEIICQYKHD